MKKYIKFILLEMTEFINVKFPIGTHIPFINKSLFETLKFAVYSGMYTFQFFLGSPQSFNRTKLTKEDIEKCKEYLKLFPTNIITHFPYVANLSGSKEILAWNGDEKQDLKTMKCIENIEYELNILAELKGGVVLHAGNHNNTMDGLKAIVKSINKIKFSKNAKLFLENMAGQGTSLCCNIREIKFILENINEEKKNNVFVCIDTCHLFAYGEYDISNVNEMQRFFKDFDNEIGISKLKLFHLNDSEAKFKSKVDRHANIGTGFIWDENDDSLKYLLDFAKTYTIPLVLETCVSDMLTINEY